MSAKSRYNYFSDQTAIQGFNRALNDYLATVQKLLVAQYLSKNNILRMYHGTSWGHPANPEAWNAGLNEHTAYSETKFKDIVDHRLDLIDFCVSKLSEELHRQFSKMVYSTINEACDRSGNTVNAVGVPITDSFITMLEKLSFSCDKDGKVHFPEVHASPKVIEKLMTALNSAPKEFRDRVDKVTEQKSSEALQREAERKAKFVGYGKELK